MKLARNLWRKLEGFLHGDDRPMHVLVSSVRKQLLPKRFWAPAGRHRRPLRPSLPAGGLSRSPAG